MKRSVKVKLTNIEIDRYFTQAAATIKEVEKQLEGVFCVPASLRGVRLR